VLGIVLVPTLMPSEGQTGSCCEWFAPTFQEVFEQSCSIVNQCYYHICVICIDDNTLCSFFLVAEDCVQNYSAVGFLLSGLELRNITHGTIHYQNTFGFFSESTAKVKVGWAA